MSDSPEQIAARLTKAQKRALLWLPADGTHTNGPIPRGARMACRRLRRLVNWRSTTWGPLVLTDNVCLTPVGQAVRAVLEAQKP